MLFDESVKFYGTYRTYQQRVLDNLVSFLDNEKIHVVAAPGSGKTTLGLELIIRLNKPSLILVPSIAIREQWIDRFCASFLSDISLKDKWISNDIKIQKPIICITYQAFYCKFFKKEKAYCSRKRIKVSVLSDIIIIALNQYLRFYVSLENIMKTLNKQADTMLTKNQKDELDKQLMNLREEKKNLYIQFKCEAITRKQYEEGRAMCDSRMLEIENRLKEVDESVSTTKEMEKNLFIELFKKYKKFTKLNREILETFVKKITVYSSKNLEIEWNFKDDLIELVNMAQEKGIELVMNEQNTLELPPKGSHRNIS